MNGTKHRYHETLVYRLAQILIKLNQGESLDVEQLADEFGVTLRTIQRDLNVRFAYLPLEKTGGRYRLDSTYLGKLNTRDIERFATLAGVRGLFPSLSDEFLGSIFDSRVQAAWLVRGHAYEDISDRRDTFSAIESAILARRRIRFDYLAWGEPRTHRAVAPYKLMNVKGIWYLAAVDGAKLKTFSFTKIANLEEQPDTFDWDGDVERRLREEGGIWFSNARQKVVVSVKAAVADYFRRRVLIANQVLEREAPNGDLVISTLVGHVNEILPIVRYWIPHIRILEPAALQIELESGLKEYLTAAGTAGAQSVAL